MIYLWGTLITKVNELTNNICGNISSIKPFDKTQIWWENYVKCINTNFVNLGTCFFNMGIQWVYVYDVCFICVINCKQIFYSIFNCNFCIRPRPSRIMSSFCFKAKGKFCNVTLNLNETLDYEYVRSLITDLYVRRIWEKAWHKGTTIYIYIYNIYCMIYEYIED